MILKTCKICGVEKPGSEFYREKTTRDKIGIYCKPCSRERASNWRKDNPGRAKEAYKKWYAANRDDKVAKCKERYYKDQAKAIARSCKWSKDNNDHCAARARRRRATDPNFAMADRLRRRVRKAMLGQGYTKHGKTKDLIGCDWETFTRHIERQFTKGMSWDNQGKWHLDHIIPLSSAKDDADMVRLCHYTNIRPLWASENRSKGGKITAIL